MPRSTCLACDEKLPQRGRPRCPACRHAFRGAGWDGIDAHWKAQHADLASYDEFWHSLCPGHRGLGDARSGFIAFDRSR